MKRTRPLYLRPPRDKSCPLVEYLLHFVPPAQGLGYLDDYDIALLSLVNKESHTNLPVPPVSPVRALLTLCNQGELDWVKDKAEYTKADLYYSFVARPRKEYHYKRWYNRFWKTVEKGAPYGFGVHCLTTLNETSGFDMLYREEFFWVRTHWNFEEIVKATPAMMVWLAENNGVLIGRTDNFGFNDMLKGHLANGEWDKVKTILPLCRKTVDPYWFLDYTTCPEALECFIQSGGVLNDTMFQCLLDNDLVSPVESNLTWMSTLLELDPSHMRHWVEKIRNRQDGHTWNLSQNYVMRPEMRAILEQYGLL